MISDLRGRFQELKKATHYTKGGVEAVLASYGSLYWRKYTEQAYLTGARRSFTEARRGLLATEGDLEGSRADFLRQLAGTTYSQSSDLAERVHTELLNTATDVATRIKRVLADGKARGSSQRQVQQDIKAVLELGFRNAQRVVQTEITRCHAAGQLDAYDRLGVQRVGVLVEWVTSKLGKTEKGNPSPCKVCKPLAGITLTLKEARGLIPRHPNCRCGFHMVATRTESQIRQKREIQRAIQRSIKAGGNRSNWSGARRKIAPRR